MVAPVTSIERYRFTLLMQQNGCSASDIRRLGGGATQFSINAGNPEIVGSQFDVGFFAGDDWRMRPNLTLSFGLRYETQNNIHDRRDFSPRFTVAWAPGAANKNSHSKTVLRAGFGVFYDRFSLSNTLTALRYNGIVQQQFVITNPDFFPAIPSISSLTAFQTTQTIQQISLRCARHTSSSQLSASNTNCRSILRLRSRTRTRTGCTCCDPRTSTLRCPALMTHSCQTVAYFRWAGRVPFS